MVNACSLYGARDVRVFADGFATITLPVYLSPPSTLMPFEAAPLDVAQERSAVARRWGGQPRELLKLLAKSAPTDKAKAPAGFIRIIDTVD
jgi:hypothetical protein